MKGFPKRIATADDIRHCFEMVQNGELDAADMLEAIRELEARNYARCPILEAIEKTITLVYCPEINEGDTVIINDEPLVVKSVTHVMDEQEQPERTLLLFDSVVPEGDAVLRSVTPDIYEILGMEKSELEEIKEALKNE